MTTNIYSSTNKFKIRKNNQSACDVEGYHHCFYLINIPWNRPWLPFPHCAIFAPNHITCLCEFTNNMAIKY